MSKLILLSITLMVIYGSFIVTVAQLNVDQEEARRLCKSMYRIEADVEGTFFLNYHCQLQCNFTGRTRIQEVNSGQSCRPDSMEADRIDYRCQSGRCLPRQVPSHHQGPPTSPIVVPVPSRQIGHLTILSTKAELTTPELDTYLMICVLNNVAEPIHHLPLEDHYWLNRCHSCSSDLVRETRTPRYISPCPMSERYPINQNSRIIFEIWTHNSTQTLRTPNGKPRQFIGGAHLRLKELIDRRNLGRPYSMHISDGITTGTITTEIDWS